MPIEINNKTKIKVDEKRVKKAVELFLKKYKLNKKNVSLAFIGDKKMQELNKTYRRIDRTTDVLAFLGEGSFLGEILISPTQVKRQAKKGFKYELIFVLIHGLLHLAGYEDKEAKARDKMMKATKDFVDLFEGLVVKK